MPFDANKLRAFFKLATTFSEFEHAAVLSSTDAKGEFGGVVRDPAVGAPAGPRALIGPHEEVVRNADGLAEALRIGATVYELIEPLRIECRNVVSSGCSFALSGFKPALAVVAPFEAVAESKWVLRAHGLIQTLRRKRKEGLDGRDAERWDELCACVDMEGFELRQPFSVRQIGEVTARRDDGLMVSWSGYEEHPLELLPFDVAPAETAGFESGDRFDAVVLRERKSWRLVEVLDATLLPTLSEDHRQEFFDALRSAPSTRDAMIAAQSVRQR
jgi:hypothetical protein